MPSQTQGRYAWSLLVLGKPYISPLSLKPTSASDPILIDDDDDEEEEDEDQKKKQVAKLSLKRANGSSSPSKDIDDDTSLSSAQSEDEFYDASEDAGHQSKKAKVETNGETSAVGTKEQNGTDKGKTKESNSGVKPQGKSLYGTNFPKGECLLKSVQACFDFVCGRSVTNHFSLLLFSSILSSISQKSIKSSHSFDIDII